MARRSGQRDTSRIATPRVLDPLFRLAPLPLAVFEDRRDFNPDGPYRRPATFSRRAFADVVLKPAPRAFSFPDVFGFRVPDKVLICVRRKQRREVLHALRRTGSGAGRRRRRNYYSAVSCR